MLILGIETSCDETAVAIVRDGRDVLANVIASQAELHSVTGGVVPEIAAREHVSAIIPTLKEALYEAHAQFDQLDAIAITYGPGLASSLLSGVATANTLATLSKKKIIGVNHIYSHIRANWLERNAKEFRYPIVTLTASGGHNDLVLICKNEEIKLLGETTDDAVGEAFDKVARLLGLPYPGGPAIEKAVGQLKVDDKQLTTINQKLIPLPRAWLVPKDRARNFDSVELGKRLRNGKTELTNFDFSFSGIKSEVRRRVENQKNKNQKFIVELATEFQEAVVDVLATKLLLAAQKFKAQEIHIAGGVSANLALRARVNKYATELGATFRYPVKISYCTDNAAMVAGAGFFLYQSNPKKYTHAKLLDINPRLTLENI